MAKRHTAPKLDPRAAVLSGNAVPPVDSGSAEHSMRPKRPCVLDQRRIQRRSPQRQSAWPVAEERHWAEDSAHHSELDSSWKLNHPVAADRTVDQVDQNESRAERDQRARSDHWAGMGPPGAFASGCMGHGRGIVPAQKAEGDVAPDAAEKAADPSTSDTDALLGQRRIRRSGSCMMLDAEAAMAVAGRAAAAVRAAVAAGRTAQRGDRVEVRRSRTLLMVSM
jgi:hypothetical protein